MKKLRIATAVLILLEVIVFFVGSIFMMFSAMHEIGGYMMATAFVLAVLPTMPMAVVCLLDEGPRF